MSILTSHLRIAGMDEPPFVPPKADWSSPPGQGGFPSYLPRRRHNFLLPRDGRYTAPCAVHHVRMLFDERRRGVLFSLASALVFAENIRLFGTELLEARSFMEMLERRVREEFLSVSRFTHALRLGASEVLSRALEDCRALGLLERIEAVGLRHAAEGRRVMQRTLQGMGEEEALTGDLLAAMRSGTIGQVEDAIEKCMLADEALESGRDEWMQAQGDAATGAATVWEVRRARLEYEARLGAVFEWEFWERRMMVEVATNWAVRGLEIVEEADEMAVACKKMVPEDSALAPATLLDSESQGQVQAVMELITEVKPTRCTFLIVFSIFVPRSAIPRSDLED